MRNDYDSDEFQSYVIDKSAEPDLVSNLSMSEVVLFSALSSGGNVTVVDVGGQAGQHWAIQKYFLPWKVRWLVLETPAAVRALSRLPREFEFSSSLEEVVARVTSNRLPDERVLLHFGSSLQYLQDAKSFLDEAMSGLAPEVILISRTPVSRKPARNPRVLLERSRAAAHGKQSQQIGYQRSGSGVRRAVVTPARYFDARTIAGWLSNRGYSVMFTSQLSSRLIFWKARTTLWLVAVRSNDHGVSSK